MIDATTVSAISAISDLATSIISVGSLVLTLLLWKGTRKSIETMQEQLRQQLADVQSASQHSILDAHRDLYLAIAQNDELLSCIENDNSNDFRSKILASLMINHALRIFVDFNNGYSKREEQEFFERDFAEILRLKFVDARWQSVKVFHPIAFREFVARIVRERINTSP